VTHQIRLRGAWQTSLPDSAAIESPLGWGKLVPEHFTGELTFLRVFHAPSGLANIMRLDLVIPPLNAPYQLTLNNDIVMSFGGHEEGRVDIKERIQPSNQILLLVEVSAGVRQPWSPKDLHIRLEIEEIGTSSESDRNPPGKI
jgi:hypothetical protein